MLASTARRCILQSTKCHPSPAAVLIACRGLSSGDKASSRGQLPIFLPDRSPADSDADFDAAAVHAKLCEAGKKRMEQIIERQNSGAPKVKAFYLADRPFRASFLQPNGSRLSALFNDLGVVWSLTKASLVNMKVFSEFSMGDMVEAYEQAVMVIVRKIAEGKGNELVEHNLMTDEAFKAIEPMISKLDSDQLRLLEISPGDFSLRSPLLTKVDMRQTDDGNVYLSYFIFDTALFAADKLELAGTRSDAKLIVKKNYPFDVPKQIYINLEFERQIAPVMSDFIVSKFNFIVVP
uniref:Uncharacterized protein n=1 Tax=Plectus sambesii TaxID=2011161 RepID=A0A914WIA5_9BILA